MLESTLIPNQSTYGFQSQLNTSYGIVFGKLAGFKRYEQRFVVMWNRNHRRWILWILLNLFLSLSLSLYIYIYLVLVVSLSLSLMHVFIYLSTSCATFFFVLFSLQQLFSVLLFFFSFFSLSLYFFFLFTFIFSSYFLSLFFFFLYFVFSCCSDIWVVGGRNFCLFTRAGVSNATITEIDPNLL